MNAIFVDTSARNNENVNLLFQKVAERVLQVREEADGVHAIPVTPGASVDEYGKVVKSYPRSSNGNGAYLSNGRHPIHSLNGGSPEKTMDGKGFHIRRSSDGISDQAVKELKEEDAATMGLCMAPFMECSSNKGEYACIIS